MHAHSDIGKGAAGLCQRKALFVDNYAGPSLGGGEVVLRSLAGGLTAAGWRVHVAGPAGAGWLGAMASVGAQVQGITFAATRLSRVVAELGGVIEAVEPDVLHTHGFFPTVAGQRAAARARPRPRAFVATVHCEPDAAFQAAPGTRAWLAAKVRRYLQKESLRHADAVVAVSGAVRGELAGQGVDERRLEVIHSGVDVPQAPCPASSPLHRPPVVAAFCRLEPVKGLDDFISAAVMLRRTVPDPPRFRIVGEGSLKERLVERISREGLTGLVELLPWPQEGHEALLADVDAVVSTSLSEGLNLSLVEAMMRGVPVVATRVGGQPEVLDGGRVGVLVPPRDPEALAGELARLLAGDPAAEAERSRLSREGCAFARERFSALRMIDAHLALYERLLT